MTLDEQEADDMMTKKLRCVDLLLGCPLNRNAPGCPFGKAREESVVTRVNWIKSLDLNRLTRLLDLHETCLAQPAERVSQ